MTYAFRTRPVPAGYAPNFCSAQAVTWWTMNDVDAALGLNRGIAGQSPFYLVLSGIETVAPWDNLNLVNDNSTFFCIWDYHTTFSKPANNLNNPPYIPMLEIFNSDVNPVDLSTTAQWVQIVNGLGESMDAKLPGVVIPAGYTLLLYIANNGSAYFAVPDQGGGQHSIDLTSDPWNTECTYDLDVGNGPCPTVDPPTAFADPPPATW